MKLRSAALAFALLTAGCATSVAGQAQPAAGAIAAATARSTPATEASGVSRAPGRIVPTSVEGLPADCNKVLAAITAFGSVLESTKPTISKATVDDALEQLPESRSPAELQADVRVLRTIVSGAAGKSVAEVGVTIVDGTALTALQRLSTWATANCT